MPLDPAAQTILTLLDDLGGANLETMTPGEARAAYALLGVSQAEDLADVASVDEGEIAGVPCRIVVPHGAGPFPVLVWLHGGGWVIGSAELSLPTARALASGAGCVVVSVDYRLAPEHSFPAAPDDCAAVARWVLAHAADLGCDPERVAIGGDSAGGNLSAVVAMEVPGLVHQLLVYPATDLTMSHPSVEENGEGYLLTRAAMDWFADQYLGDSDPKDPRVSPLFADVAALACVPPAHVVTAEYDPLRDEGEAYADRLRDAGVKVTGTRYDGQIHGFFSMAAMMPAAAEALEEAAAVLRDAFGSRDGSLSREGSA